MKKIIFVLILGILASVNFIVVNVYAQSSSSTVCCEKTISGAFCQDVPVSECDPEFRQVPTSCDSTSYCKAGTCFDSSEGICLDNTPQLVCNDNGGIWSENSPAQCELGCCILEDQAAFVSLVRCKRLSSSLGLETNYDTSVQSELECIAKVQAQDKGACVFEFEFEKACRFTTRAECEGVSESRNGTISDGEFFKDKLCSAEELGTICGPSEKTTCLPGRDEVYFADTCGNAANIYDASKINNKAYWTNVISKSESCGFNSGNIESASCGNCNYLLGSFCRDKDIANARATYGEFICADLNCKDESGEIRLHGESWCANDDVGTEKGDDTVGSRFFRRICINGEITVEACEDFRNEICIEDAIGDFSQAACRVNRWRDCVSQTNKQDCENTDRRDCFWISGERIENVQRAENSEIPAGSCLPMHAPGLNFWNSEETLQICSQGNTQCIVEFEKGLFDDENECKKNCHCLEDKWLADRKNICVALGDCGPNTNWLGDSGNKEGFKRIIDRL